MEAAEKSVAKRMLFRKNLAAGQWRFHMPPVLPSAAITPCGLHSHAAYANTIFAVLRLDAIRARRPTEPRFMPSIPFSC